MDNMRKQKTFKYILRILFTKKIKIVINLIKYTTYIPTTTYVHHIGNDVVLE